MRCEHDDRLWLCATTIASAPAMSAFQTRDGGDGSLHHDHQEVALFFEGLRLYEDVSSPSVMVFSEPRTDGGGEEGFRREVRGRERETQRGEMKWTCTLWPL
jgi:hypothetical protein